jgi:hypothetical protein
MSDRPDYTLPISIESVIIESLPIEVVAWSIGTIAVDIASQTVGNIGVDIKAATAKVAITITSTDITGNIPVDIKAQTIGNIGIDIKAQTVGNIGVDIKAQTLGTINIAINVANITGNLPIDIKAQTIGNIGIDIKAQTLTTLNINISSQSAFNLNVNIAASAATLNVNITGSTTLNVNITGSTTINIQGVPGGTAVTISGTVSVSGTVTVSGTVSITGTVTVSGTVSISGTVTVTGSVTVSGTVSISGTVTITGTVTISGTVTITGNVTITSGTVNIQTSGGANIVIDKLTQSAYLEDRRTLSNNGATASADSATGDARAGKFFPRGCRSFIETIDVYCWDAGAAGGTITVYISPHPSMGVVASAVITIAAGGGAAWRSATFNRMWNYDSLFIFVVGSTANMKFGYDTGSPNDNYWSTDGGATWITQAYRNWFRAIMKGETCGDLPVSGTINTIEIPHSSDTHVFITNNNLTTTFTDLVNVYGAGEMVYIRFRVAAKANSQLTNMKISCDGKVVFWEDFASLSDKYGYTASSSNINVLKYAVDGICVVHIVLPFKFLRIFNVQMAATVTTGQSVEVEGVVNLIR